MERDEELKLFKSIAEYKDTNGGKVLLGFIVKEVVATMRTLADKHTTMTQNEFIVLGANLKAKLDLYDVLTNAKQNQKSIEEDIKRELLP